MLFYKENKMITWWIFVSLVSLALFALPQTLPLVIVESIAMVTSSICVWDAAKNRERNWPIGAISSVAFFIIFAHAKLYGNMVLQIIYIAQALWGHWIWRFGGEKKSSLPINRLPVFSVRQYIVLFVLVTIGTNILLTSLNGSAPFWDTITTVLSIVANQLLIRRRTENWYVWIVNDTISVVLFASQGLWLTTATFVLYLIIAFAKALPTWKKEI
jgi:nicotinamide mononucleotide transporter